jgi:internalin A
MHFLKKSIFITGISALVLAGFARIATACGEGMLIATVQESTKAEDYRTFAEWCTNRAQLPLETRNTVDSLLALAETSDCHQANEKLTHITELAYPQNSIRDLRPLQALPQLISLSIERNQISDLSPLQTLTNLTHLNISETSIEDLSPLESLTNLTELNLKGTLVTDISPLKPLKNLTF